MIPGNKKPKTVFIDWYGTLSSSLFWEQLKDRAHPEHDKYEIIEKVLFNQMKEFFAPWMRGELNTKQVIKKLSDQSNISSQLLLSTLEESCRNMRFTSDRILPLIQSLRGIGIQVVIATDNMDTFDMWTVPSLNLKTHFDEILNSFTIHALKKDFDNNGHNMFFNNYLSRHGISPDETILFDDSIDVDNKIQNYGVKYIQVEKNMGLEVALQELIKTLNAK